MIGSFVVGSSTGRFVGSFAGRYVGRFVGRFVSGGTRYVSACVWVVGLGFSGVRGNRMIHVRRARSVRQRLTESWYGYPLTPISDQILVKGYRWSKYLLVPPRLSKHPEEDLGAGLIISGTGYAGSGSSYGNVLFV